MAAVVTHPGWPPEACTCHRQPGDSPTVPRGRNAGGGPHLPGRGPPRQGRREPTAVPSRPDATTRLGGRNDRHRACWSASRGNPPQAAEHPYPSFCFSSLLIGAAPAVHTDVADTRQNAAVAATRLHGARWGTEDPPPRPPPALLMAPRFRARAAATPGLGDTLPDAGGKRAASRAQGGMRSKASGRRRRTVSRSLRDGPQRQRCHRPPQPAAPPPSFPVS